MTNGKPPEADDALFARNMAALREDASMSQSELAKRLNDLGWDSVYQTTISRIEKGDRPVRVGEARLIARALHTDLASMMLSAAESAHARKLSRARQDLSNAERVIREGSTQWYGARRRLEAVVAEVTSAGVTPTPYDRTESLVPTTVEDELALALAALEREPQTAVRHGQLFDRARGSGEA